MKILLCLKSFLPFFNILYVYDKKSSVQERNVSWCHVHWGDGHITYKVRTCVCPPSVSQMVIEEVSVLQTQLEIEKSCRENAEALATKVCLSLTHTHTLNNQCYKSSIISWHEQNNRWTVESGWLCRDVWIHYLCTLLPTQQELCSCLNFYNVQR